MHVQGVSNSKLIMRGHRHSIAAFVSKNNTKLLLKKKSRGEWSRRSALEVLRWLQGQGHCIPEGVGGDFTSTYHIFIFRGKVSGQLTTPFKAQKQVKTLILQKDYGSTRSSKFTMRGYYTTLIVSHLDPNTGPAKCRKQARQNRL